MPIDHARHSGIFQLDNRTITLIGCGGIGALTAISLGKMGISGLRLFDDDTVDDINLATQFHMLSDVGSRKVNAVAENVEMFSGLNTIDRHVDRVDRDTDLSDWVVVSAVDSINARKAIWEAVQHCSDTQWYLDARMSAEVFHLYVVDMADPDSIKFYDNLISSVDESQVSEEPCTSKATIFCANIAAGLICATIRKIATGITPSKYLVHDIINDVITIIE